MSEIVFEPGQEWQYQTRPVDEGSTLVIGAIETHERLGDIVHIAVNGAHVINPKTEGGFSNGIGHIPITKQALADCVLKIVNTCVEAPSIDEGIKTWKEADGGVFEISVAQAVQIVEDVMSGKISNE